MDLVSPRCIVFGRLGQKKINEAPALDGMYGNFAGRDASRGMAKQSFDEGEFYNCRCFTPKLNFVLRNVDTYRPTP